MRNSLSCSMHGGSGNRSLNRKSIVMHFSMLDVKPAGVLNNLEKVCCSLIEVRHQYLNCLLQLTASSLLGINKIGRTWPERAYTGLQQSEMWKPPVPMIVEGSSCKNKSWTIVCFVLGDGAADGSKVVTANGVADDSSWDSTDFKIVRDDANRLLRS